LDVRATAVNTGTTHPLLGVRCRAGEAFAVGMRGTIRRWNGQEWTAENSGTDENLYAVAITSATAIDIASASASVSECRPGATVAVGGNLHIGGDSLILHRGDHGWLAEPSGMQHILLTVAHGGLGWFAGGYNGGIIRGEPGSWSRMEVVHYSHVFAVAVTDSRAFAAGLTGTVIEFDGESWHSHDTPTKVHLRGLASTPAGGLVAVGLSGTILRYDGRRWRAEESPTTNHLEAIWVASDDEAYAVGYAGTFLRCDGKRWIRLDLGLETNLHAVHGAEEEVIAVGGDGVAVHLTPS
jgi:hypothetical protein